METTTSTDAPEYLPLGPAPRPTTGPELARWIHAALVTEMRDEATGLERVRVSATTPGTGPDVTTLEIDVTGVTATPSDMVPGQAPGNRGRKAWTPQVVAREPARIGTMRVDAHPVTVVDLPVDLGVELMDVPFVWVEGADGRVGVELVEPTSDAPMTGHARVAASKEGLVATFRGVLTVVLAQQGITLTDLDLDLVSEGPRAVRVDARAGVRKGMFLKASVTAAASAAVDQDLVLTLRDVSLHSANPLVAALLAAMRGKVEEVSGRRIDLAQHLPSGIRVADVRLDVGQDLVLTARLA